MFRRKKQKQEENINFETKNYKIKDKFDSNKLVIANLEYISSTPITPFGPKVIQTEQRYLFEIINENGKTRYREIFTGFIADFKKDDYFDIPYVVNITELKEEIPTVLEEVPKNSLLLLLNEINTNKKEKILKK